MASLFVSKFSIAPEKKEEFVRRLHAMYVAAKPILDAETTVLFYGWDRDGKFVAVESYRNEEMLNAMRASDGFKAGYRGLMECANGPMTLEIFSGVDLANPVFGHDRKLFDETYPKGESKVHDPVDGKKTFIL